MKNKVIFNPKYSKKGFFLEYESMNKHYWMQIFLRLLAFILDFSMAVGLWLVMYLVVLKNTNIVIPFLVPILYYAIYSTLVPMITKGKTIGLWISRLRIVHKSGFKTSQSNYYFRGILTTLYAIPFLGQILMIFSTLSSFLTKGISVLDVVSNTVVVSEKTYEKFVQIEKEYEDESKFKI